MQRTQRFVAAAGMAIAGIAALGACAPGTPDEQAVERAELDSRADAALASLNLNQPITQPLGARAAGILIFPSMLKGGIAGVTAESGDGPLRIGGETVAYYDTTAVGLGLALGAQAYSKVVMFMTQEALDDFRASSGWEAGVDGSITVLTLDAAAQLDTDNIQDDIITSSSTARV